MTQVDAIKGTYGHNRFLYRLEILYAIVNFQDEEISGNLCFDQSFIENIFSDLNGIGGSTFSQVIRHYPKI